MEKHLLKVLLIGSCLILGQSVAYATTLTSLIQAIRADALSGPARISIKLVGDTACPDNGWFSFDNADTGIGKVWTDIAVAAYQSNKEVTITGTGTCDALGVEGISILDTGKATIEFNPQ
jgi:hypothetical protein